MRSPSLDFMQSEIRPFILDSNGVTIKLKSGYIVGTRGKADGDTSGTIYTAVDENSVQSGTIDNSKKCTTLVTNMDDLFFQKNSFNDDISSWDVSNVTTMRRMFGNAVSFNQSLNDWNVSNVINMKEMFRDADSFNKPLNNWDVSNVTNMFAMLDNADVFNQDLSGWCVEQIASKPSLFDTSTPNWTLPKPNWGATC